MADSLKNQVLCSVFACLADQIMSRGKTSESFAAIIILLKNMKPEQPVVDFVAKKYLEIFRNNRDFPARHNIDALDAATRVIDFAASAAVVEEVIRETAKMGWYGRIEDMAKRLLNRGLTEQEMRWLVDSYLDHKGTQSNSAEETLCELARKYLKPQEARNVEIRLQKFRRAFESDPL